MTEVVISDEDWEIVEERLQKMPEEFKLGLLSKSFTKRELMEEVKHRTEVGKVYAEMQLDFIKWIAKQGKIV